MSKITVRLLFGFTILALARASVAAVVGPSVLPWSVGFWHQTDDEDPSDVRDTFEFRANGMWVNYSPSCTFVKGYFDVFGEDLIALHDLAKGPIALVFRPDKTHQKLFYTSPRTRNNATYSKVPTPAPCAAAP